MRSKWVRLLLLTALMGCNRADGQKSAPAEESGEPAPPPTAESSAESTVPAPDETSPATVLQRRIEEIGALKLPAVRSTRPLSELSRVFVTRREIAVGDKRVVPVVCKWQGRECLPEDLAAAGASFSIDPVNKEHGKREALTIPALREELAKARAGAGTHKRVSLAVDQRVPFRMLAEVVYTCAMAGFEGVELIVASKTGFGTFEVGFPQMATPRPTGAAPPKPLNPLVYVGSKGFALDWDQSLKRDAEKTPRIAPLAPPGSACEGAQAGCFQGRDGCQCQDFAALYTELARLKARYGARAGRRIMLSADLSVPWGTLARTMWTAQCLRDKPSYASMAALDAAPPRVRADAQATGAERCAELFGESVIALTGGPPRQEGAKDSASPQTDLPPGARIRISVGSVTLEGGALMKAIIKKYVNRRKSFAVRCHDKNVPAGPGLEGEVVVGFTILPTGRVSATSIVSSDLENTAVEACLTRKLGRWRFPAPAGAQPLLVKVPIQFARP